MYSILPYASRRSVRVHGQDESIGALRGSDDGRLPSAEAYFRIGTIETIAKQPPRQPTRLMSRRARMLALVA